MPGLWVDFVDQNKAAEAGIARLNVRRAYETGRRHAVEATEEGWAPEAGAASPPRSEAFDPITMIDRLVQDAVAQRVAQLVPANVAPLAPAIITPMETGAPAPIEVARSDAPTASDRMSPLLQEFLRPAGRKRQHKMKGRGEAGHSRSANRSEDRSARTAGDKADGEVLLVAKELTVLKTY
jgi:hypothetical protein